MLGCIWLRHLEDAQATGQAVGQLRATLPPIISLALDTVRSQICLIVRSLSTQARRVTPLKPRCRDVQSRPEASREIGQELHSRPPVGFDDPAREIAGQARPRQGVRHALRASQDV